MDTTYLMIFILVVTPVAMGVALYVSRDKEKRPDNRPDAKILRPDFRRKRREPPPDGPA